MSQPTTYVRAFNFTNQQAVTPSDPLPADKVDLEFNLVKTSLDETQSNLGLIQRDDGAVRNESIGYDQLKAELNGFGFNPPAPWATATNYIARDTVFEDAGFYQCVTSHISGVFATDLAAGKWLLVADFTAATTDAAASAAAALVSQNAAAASETAAGLSETAAAASAALADADAVATAADRVQTGLDRAATAADVVSAEADRVATAADAVATAADRVQTGLDRIAAAASAVAAATYSVVNAILSYATKATPVAGDLFGFVQASDGTGRKLTFANLQAAILGGFSNTFALTGSVVQSASAPYATNTDIAAAIPYDDTIPQVGEGISVASTSIAPLSATNKIRVTFTGEGTLDVVGALIVALFKTGSADAIGVSYTFVPVANYGVQVVATAEFVAGTTSSITIEARVGVTSGTARLNGTTTTRLFGGAMAAVLRIEELKA